MRILLLVHGFNSLSQRLHVELSERAHEVSVEYDINDSVTREAVELFQPDLVVAPFLKRAIPAEVWRTRLCFVVHPGPPGDQGPSALDWAILDRETRWGVTVLQAEAEMDAGPVWAWREFPLRDATKSSLYRHEVTDAAVACVLEAIDRVESGKGPLVAALRRGRRRPPVRRDDRAVDWRRDDTATVLRKMRSAQGMPGLRDTVLDREVLLFDPRPAPGHDGPPGELLATSGPAICRATIDGAVWIGHARDPAIERSFKLPATRVLADLVSGLPEVPVDSALGYREIRYREFGRVGFLSFDFYNGAMGTEQCRRLLDALNRALSARTRVLVLDGGSDYWSNGIHLNLIEAAASPADESWANINAMDDLAETLIRCTDKLTVAAVGENAGAGGVFLALASDRVWLREGTILTPHYKDMGNLYGSEFWTYLLPRRAGEDNARRIVEQRLPMGAAEACRLGLADRRFTVARRDFRDAVLMEAACLADGTGYLDALDTKAYRRTRDEIAKPLADYRCEELDRMRTNFYGFDPSYHVARYNFVRKIPKSRTPVTLARHRVGYPVERRRAS